MRQSSPLSVLVPQSYLYHGEPMAGTPDITLDELPELYQDLESQHLVLLWEIFPRLLPHEPQP
jgi:hypothetical protein